MIKTRVAVLRGGPSSEYEVSLKTGNAVLQNLPEDKYIAQDVFIDRSGVWHVRGCPKDPSSILEGTDVVFNAMHGEFGEDGSVQKILERFAVPYTGTKAGASALCMNKRATKETLFPYFEDQDVNENLGIKFSKHAVVDKSSSLNNKLEEIYASFAKPIVIKPIAGGSSVGVSIVRDYDEFVQTVQDLLESIPRVFCEEYVEGKEATCGVVEDFRGEPIYALLPIEIQLAEGHSFFDYEAKYAGASKEICPGNFTTKEKDVIQQLSRRVHNILGLRHYSRSDFIVTPKGIYFLEVNTLPGLTSESLLPKALQAIGCTFPQFLDHLVELALER